MKKVSNLHYIGIEILEAVLHKPLRKYWIQIGFQKVLFKPKEIIRVSADGSYAHFITIHGVYHISHNLSCMEEVLSGWGFVRVSRSHIINVTHVDKLIWGNPSKILMGDGYKIIIPRRASKTMINKLQKLY